MHSWGPMDIFAWGLGHSGAISGLNLIFSKWPIEIAVGFQSFVDFHVAGKGLWISRQMVSPPQ